MNDRAAYRVDRDSLPTHYPTHLHDDYFWECLGRAVATFGFLEGTLVKAIFAITATTTYREDEIAGAYQRWIPKVERSLSDQLNALIDTYAKALKDNTDTRLGHADQLLEDLRKAAKIRNVLCHGSWNQPDKSKASLPFYVDRKGEMFETAIDVQFLQRLQSHVSELICSVIDSVTLMGWQFPSTGGPGEVIWRKK